MLKPPDDRSTSPRATAVDENTPMIVSVDVLLLFLMIVITTAKTTENRTAPTSGCSPPNSAPMAIPVNAPCPMESEKNAILLLTTIVPSRPNSGVIKSTASSAFFMKLCSAHSKGSRNSTISYQACSIIRYLPPDPRASRPQKTR